MNKQMLLVVAVVLLLFSFLTFGVHFGVSEGKINKIVAGLPMNTNEKVSDTSKVYNVTLIKNKSKKQYALGKQKNGMKCTQTVRYSQNRYIVADEKCKKLKRNQSTSNFIEWTN